MPLPALIGGALAAGAVNGLFGMLGNRQQYNQQMALNENAYANDLRMWRLNNKYNSPEAQMRRLEAAGLNPNLMYGQGTVGNSSSMPSYPQSKAPDWSFMTQIVPAFQQARLTEAQVDLTKQKVEESGIKQDLMKSQKALIEANPYLNKSYVEAFVANMQVTAELKKMEQNVRPINQAKAIEKIQNEINLLSQRFNLGQKDQEIKAEILKSKEFQNAILEVQAKFIRDGEIGPQQIMMFIQSVLTLLK